MEQPPVLSLSQHEFRDHVLKPFVDLKSEITAASKCLADLRKIEKQKSADILAWMEKNQCTSVKYQGQTFSVQEKQSKTMVKPEFMKTKMVEVLGISEAQATECATKIMQDRPVTVKRKLVEEKPKTNKKLKTDE